MIYREQFKIAINKVKKKIYTILNGTLHVSTHGSREREREGGHKHNTKKWKKYNF